jgi:hypothetical protein
VLQERERRLGHDVQHSHSSLQILDEALQECDEMFGFANVTWNCLLEKVVGKYWKGGSSTDFLKVRRESSITWICDIGIFRRLLITALLQAFNELGILVLQLSRVVHFDAVKSSDARSREKMINALLNLFPKLCYTSRCGVEHRPSKVDAEGFDADIVWQYPVIIWHDMSQKATYRCCEPRQRQQWSLL